MTGTPVTPDEHHVIVGKLEHNACAAEAMMFAVFRILSGTSVKVARAIFYTLDSFPGKKNLLLRVARETANPEELDLIDLVISGVEKCNNQRKQVAHSIMLFTDTSTMSGLTKIISPKTDGKGKLPSKEWHAHLLEDSYSGGQEVTSAFQKICQKRGVPPKVDFE